MRKVSLTLALILTLLALVLCWRTLQFKSKQVDVEPVSEVALDSQAAAKRLAQAVGYKTISYEDDARSDYQEFLKFQAFLEEAFPRVRGNLTREVVSDYSLLYKWEGSDASLRPVILLAHQDVVPVEQETEGRWTYPPFGGVIEKDFIWGRGSLDDKLCVMGILEATEMLLSEGLRPRRTIYFAFGHDEEVGGGRGAVQLATLLESRGIRAEYILDEGGIVADGILAGVPRPVAVVGTAEKGSLSIELVVRSAGGHSSQPPPHTAVGILGAAISRLEGQQMAAELTDVPRQMFEYVGPETPFAQRLVLANLWLFNPLVERRLIASPATAAMIRTTTAPTVIRGGTKENVLPTEARAVVNFRIRPGDSIDGVMEHVRRTIADPQVEINRGGRMASEPSRASDVNSASFAVLARTIRQTFPSVIVAPYLVIGATDARHYAKLSDNIYRFQPVVLTSEDLKLLHGINERISVSSYERCIRFYRLLILNSVS